MENNLNSPLLPEGDTAVKPERAYPLHSPQTTNLSDERVAQADRRREQEREEISALDFAKTVREQDFIFPALDDLINEVNFPVDETWEGPTDDMLKETNIPQELAPELFKTVSEDHYVQTVTKMQRSLANEEQLAGFGVKGAFARFGLNMADPGNLAIAATFPLAELGVPQGLAIMKGGRLGRAARLGFIGGAESAGIQALINEADPAQDDANILYAGLFGLGFGGAVGGAFGKGSKNLQQEIEDYAMDAAREVENIRNGNSTTGAMEVTGPEANQSLADKPLTPEEINSPRSAMEMARFDTAAGASRSGLDSARKLGIDMVEDGVGKQGHAVNSAGGSASTIQRKTAKVWQIDMRHAIEPAYVEYSKKFSRSKRFFNQTSIRNDFFRQVFREKEIGGSSDPSVIKAANALRPVYDRMLDEQKAAGVFGAKAIDNDARYAPHIWEPRKVRQAIDETNFKTVANLFSNAMVKGIDLDEDELMHIDRVATAIVKRMDSKASSIDEMQGFSLNMADAEQLRILMREVGEVVDEDAIETMVQTVTRKQQQAKQAGHLRRRMDLDMTASVRNPVTGKEMSLYDLMEDDIEKATLRYIQKTAGLVGFARKGYGRERSVDADINATLRRIEEEARTKGTNPEKATNLIKSLRSAADNVLGRPMDTLQRTAFGRALRSATDAAFIRYMGQTGAASLAEIAQAIAYAGMANAMKQFAPSFTSMFKTVAKRSTEGRNLATELESMSGVGGFRLNNQTSARYNDHDIDYLKKVWKNFDNVLQRGKQYTVRYSGISLVTDFSQELAARAGAQRFYNDAMNARGNFEKVWEKRWKRLHLYGLEKHMAKRIFDQIVKNAEGTPSVFGGNLKLGRLNVADWDDKKALDHFSDAMFRMTTHAVQEQDPGNLARWMHYDLAKAFMQFRSFITGAYTKSTLNGIHMRDTEAGLGFIMSMTIGWGAYVMQQQLNSIGREDRDRVLDERLSTERQLAAFFSRSAFASFTPVIIDGILETFGEDQLFNYTRSSGQTQLTLPALDMVGSANSLRKVAASGLTGREVTETDMDSAMGLISNMWVLRNITSAIDDGVDLPYEQDN